MERGVWDPVWMLERRQAHGGLGRSGDEARDALRLRQGQSGPLGVFLVRQPRLRSSSGAAVPLAAAAAAAAQRRRKPRAAEAARAPSWVCKPSGALGPVRAWATRTQAGSPGAHQGRGPPSGALHAAAGCRCGDTVAPTVAATAGAAAAAAAARSGATPDSAGGKRRAPPTLRSGFRMQLWHSRPPARTALTCAHPAPLQNCTTGPGYNNFTCSYLVLND